MKSKKSNAWGTFVQKIRGFVERTSFGKILFFLDKPREFADSIGKQSMVEIVKVYAITDLIAAIFIGLFIAWLAVSKNIWEQDFWVATTMVAIAAFFVSMMAVLILAGIIHMTARLLGGKSRFSDTIIIVFANSAAAFLITITFIAGIGLSGALLLLTRIIIGKLYAPIAAVLLLVPILGMAYLSLLNFLSIIKALSQAHKISQAKIAFAYFAAFFAMQFIGMGILSLVFSHP